MLSGLIGLTPFTLLIKMYAAKVILNIQVANGSTDLNGFIVVVLEVNRNFAESYFNQRY